MSLKSEQRWKWISLLLLVILAGLSSVLFKLSGQM